MTKDGKAAPQQQEAEHAGKKEKPTQNTGIGAAFYDALATNRDVLQFVEKLALASRKWPRVQRALLSCVEPLEFGIAMTKKTAELVSEHVTGSDTDQAKKEMAAIGLHTEERWRARGDVPDEFFRTHECWLMRSWNGGGKHFVLDASEALSIDPKTHIRPLGVSWSDLHADAHEQDQEWRFVGSVDRKLLRLDQRWQSRFNPMEEISTSVVGFVGRASWWPRIQIRPMGATWQQLEEMALAQSQADVKQPQGVN